MNWYKRQLKKSEDWSTERRRRQPEDIREIDQYYRGEDPPVDQKRKYVLENERANDFAMENDIRYKRWKKVYDHQEVIKELQEQIKDPSLTAEQVAEITRKIVRLNSAISTILGTTPKPIKRRERLGDYY